AGSFSPPDPDPGVKDEGVLLTQIVAELRVEAHAALGPAEIFVQASPRFGGLFYLAEEGDSPSSFVAGVLLTAGLRFGGDERRVGAEAGAVVHSSFGGWLAQGTYNLGMDPPHDEQPPVPIDDIPVPGEAPVEEGEAPPG
ncbi:MAG: hypothetical protein KC549_11745, partial [Myxococcales bacterium]|nr:hypothetical protein [Myxococcales bacterium]